MRRAPMLLVVLLAGCYSLGPVVMEVRPVSGPDGHQELEVRRCMLAWGAMKQLQTEDCKTETLPMSTRAAPRR